MPWALDVHEVLGYSRHLAALLVTNREQSIAKLIARPRAHLDEDQALTVLGDDVELPEATAIVSPQNAKAALLEERGCSVFGSLTAIDRRQ